MERHVFERLLREVTIEVMDFSRPYLIDELPDQVEYVISPNNGYTGRPLQGDEERFPELYLPPGQEYMPPMDAAGVVALLWQRSGKVPGWINVSVAAAEAERTLISLVCSAGFTACGPPHAGSPFRVLSPPLPPTWPHEPPLPWWLMLEDRNDEALIARHGKFRLRSRYLTLLQEQQNKDAGESAPT